MAPAVILPHPPFSSHKNTPTDYRRAKRLRRTATDGEQILWQALREATRSTGIRFRRQHPIHPYIVDFVCLQLRLIVEVDGVSHERREEKDLKRAAVLAQKGYRILRYTNEDVIRNTDAVVLSILS
ncbi:MAG: DUF559 domain-containing protein [Alphaproteobacteria bacterium]|nr:DUF559 domain-containing protein [Alphaproteobacteria bacterium]